MTKVKFVKSPTAAPFFMAYNAGETAEVSDEVATKLIEGKLAIIVTDDAEAEAKAKAEAEAAEKAEAEAKNQPETAESKTHAKADKAEKR